MKSEKTSTVNTSSKNKAGASMEAPDKAQFVSVPVEVLGKVKGKNYVSLKGLSYNPELGNLSLHLDDKHTLIFKNAFQRDYMKVVLKTTDKVEQSVKKAPEFEKPLGETSTARLRLMGERDGRMFLGATGAVKYDGSYRGLVINLDDKHMTVVDSEMLSKNLGITVNPIAMEKNVGLSR